MNIFVPLEAKGPTLHGSRSAFELRGDVLSKAGSEGQHVLTCVGKQDTKDLQTIASLVARRQGIPIADVWNDVVFLYFERFKESGQSTSNTSSGRNFFQNDGDAGNPIKCNITSGDRRPPLTTTSSIHEHFRDFSFNFGDDRAASDRSLTLHTKSSSPQSPPRNSPGPKDELLQAVYSPQKSTENSTTPESEKRARDYLKRSRIPSPIQDISFLARPRRESSTSSMLTSVNVGRDRLQTMYSDVPKLALTPAGYTKDHEPDEQIQQQMYVKPSSPSHEKPWRRNLIQSKSTESLKRGGEGRLTTSTFARRMKNIGSSSKSPSK